MEKISINLKWSLDNGELSPGKYSNKHQIKFNDEIVINGDAAPDWNGNKQNSNPEQALAAALSSCHMMTFLALAAKMNWPVSGYTDNAIATLGKNSKGKMSVSNISIIFFTQSDISSIDFNEGPSESPCPGRSIDKTLNPLAE